MTSIPSSSASVRGRSEEVKDSRPSKFRSIYIEENDEKGSVPPPPLSEIDPRRVQHVATSTLSAPQAPLYNVKDLMIRQINSGRPLVDIMKENEIIDFLIVHGSEVTCLNLSYLDDCLNPEAFIALLESIAMVPVLNLSTLIVESISEDLGEKVAKAFSSIFERFRGLSKICINSYTTNPVFFKFLIQGCKHLLNLTSLEIGQLQKEEILLLRETLPNPIKLRELNINAFLSSCKPIADWLPWMPNLETLTIFGPDMFEEGECDLSETISLAKRLCYTPKLTSICLTNAGIGFLAAESFGLAFQKLANLRAVQFDSCNMGDQEIIRFFDILNHHRMIESIEISDNPIGANPEVSKEIEKIIASRIPFFPRLKTMDFSPLNGFGKMIDDIMKAKRNQPREEYVYPNIDGRGNRNILHDRK